MNDDDFERAHQQLNAAKSALAAVDELISGKPGAFLSVDHLGWLRAMLLDQIEVAETTLGIEHAQTAESVARTIQLGMNAGILDALANPAQHLPEPEDRGLPGLYWLLHLPCPECGEPGVEQTGPDPGSGDHHAVIVHPDRDEYDSPIGTRGGYTQIDLWCPVGHQFALIIANHKGNEYIGTVTAARAEESARRLPPGRQTSGLSSTLPETRERPACEGGCHDSGWMVSRNPAR